MKKLILILELINLFIISILSLLFHIIFFGAFKNQRRNYIKKETERLKVKMKELKK